VSTHARLSPSSRVRWQNCPASVAACAKYEGRETRSNPAAVDGTHSHTLLEHCIVHAPKGTVDDPQKFLGLVLQDHEGPFSVTQDRIDRVRVATDYIRGRLTETSIIHAERRVDPALLVGRPDLGGTVDVTIINEGVREIIDYKDGMAFVDVVGNLQLEQYVFGDLASVIAEKQELPETVITTIIQPKLAFSGAAPINSCEHPVGHFIERLPIILEAASATDDPNAPFVPGEKQCQYCAHRGACTAASTDALFKSGIKFADMNVVKDAATTDPTTMTDEQLTEIVLAAPLLRKMVEAAEDEALARIRSGHAVPGLKVVKGSGRNIWAKDEADVAAALKKMGVPKDELYKTTVVSAPQALKLKWVKKDGTAKQLTPRQLKVLETEFIMKSEGKETVVPEADGREAVVYTEVSKLFAPVPAGDSLPAWLS